MYKSRDYSRDYAHSPCYIKGDKNPRTLGLLHYYTLVNIIILTLYVYPTSVLAYNS